MKILFTCVGRRVELLQAFQNAARKLNMDLLLYGTDTSASAPALVFCDRSIEICGIKDENYIPTLLEICEKEGVDALIPTIDTDLLILAENKGRFASIGTRVIVSEKDKIALCRDKRLTCGFLKSCGLKAPVPVDDYTNYDMGYPAFIKPLNGSSSINAFKVSNFKELKSRAEGMEGYIVQKFVSGKEYTVDIFCDFEHRPVFITPRERIAVRSGEVLKTRICQDEQIKAECRKLIDKFEPVGQITVQLMRDEKTGEDHYIEINPRFGGGAPLSIKAGADSAEAVLRLLNGERLVYEDAAADGMVFSRFDQSVCVGHGKAEEVRAVIFDLDDTLYSEKDYIRSGFEAIEDETGIPAAALWEAFEDGNPAVDTVLTRMGRMDLKEQCLEIYRNHVPRISLYRGVREMLSTLRNNGIFTGIITDGRSVSQRKKIQALGLEVDKIVVTDELGGERFRKPCDLAFRIMQRAANVDFGEMVYVADNPSKDFLAPKQLGMQTIWFDNKEGIYRKKKYDGCKVTSIYEILQKLLPLVKFEMR